MGLYWNNVNLNIRTIEAPPYTHTYVSTHERKHPLGTTYVSTRVGTFRCTPNSGR